MYSQILFEVTDGVGIITINRPKKLNALTATIMKEIEDVLDNAKDNDEIGALLLRGAGDHFSSGFDVGDDLKEEGTSIYDRWNAWHNSDARREKIYNYPKPIVSEIKGYCLGGGLELATLTDIVVAADNSKFGLTELKLSLIPLPRTVFFCSNIRQAKEIMMMAEQFGAEKAEQLGLVNHVVPRTDLENESMRIAKRLARLPGETMHLIKKMCNKALSAQGFDQINDWGSDMALMAMLMKTKMREQFDAMAEKEGMKSAFRWINDYYDGKVD